MFCNPFHPDSSRKQPLSPADALSSNKFCSCSCMVLMKHYLYLKDINAWLWSRTIAGNITQYRIGTCYGTMPFQHREPSHWHMTGAGMHHAFMQAIAERWDLAFCLVLRISISLHGSKISPDRPASVAIATIKLVMEYIQNHIRSFAFCCWQVSGQDVIDVYWLKSLILRSGIDLPGLSVTCCR